MTSTDIDRATRATSLVDALSLLEQMIPLGSRRADATQNKARRLDRISQFTEMIHGSLDAAPSIRGGKKQVDRAIQALEHARDAASDALRAVQALGESAWDEIFGGIDSRPNPSDAWAGDPDKLLSGEDYDQLVATLRACVDGFKAAATHAEKSGFLTATQAKVGRASEKSKQDHILRCARYVDELGGTRFIKRSEEGLFHQFVIAVAQAAGVEGISRRQLMAGVESYHRSPKSDEAESFSD